VYRIQFTIFDVTNSHVAYSEISQKHFITYVQSNRTSLVDRTSLFVCKKNL